MNRREALKATGGILIGHKLSEFAFDLRPAGGKYIVFFDPKMMRSDVSDWGKEFPPNTVFHAVDVPPGKTLDDAIRIFTES